MRLSCFDEIWMQALRPMWQLDCRQAAADLAARTAHFFSPAREPSHRTSSATYLLPLVIYLSIKRCEWTEVVLQIVNSLTYLIIGTNGTQCTRSTGTVVSTGPMCLYMNLPSWRSSSVSPRMRVVCAQKKRREGSSLSWDAYRTLFGPEPWIFMSGESDATCSWTTKLPLTRTHIYMGKGQFPWMRMFQKVGLVLWCAVHVHCNAMPIFGPFLFMWIGLFPSHCGSNLKAAASKFEVHHHPFHHRDRTLCKWSSSFWFIDMYAAKIELFDTLWF